MHIVNILISCGLLNSDTPEYLSNVNNFTILPFATGKLIIREISLTNALGKDAKEISLRTGNF